MKNTSEVIAKALRATTGPSTSSHSNRQSALRLLSSADRSLRQGDGALSAHVEGEGRPRAESSSEAKRRGKKPIGNQSFIDIRTELYRISGVDFTQIPGLDALTAQTILSEVGLDPGKFPTEKRFVSWLGLCPNNRITGGEVKSTKTRKTVNRAANAFSMGAQTLANSNVALGGFYRRIRSRLGSPKAITATAHKLARIFYRMWTTGQAYADLGKTTMRIATRSGCFAISPRGLGNWGTMQYYNRSSRGLLRRCHT